jgi:hypothetical protein
MYMPAFGLVSLPLLVQIISIWCELFLKKNETQFSINEKVHIFSEIFTFKRSLIILYLFLSGLYF